MHNQNYLLFTLIFGHNYSLTTVHTEVSALCCMTDFFCGKIKCDSYNFGADKMAFNKAFV